MRPQSARLLLSTRRSRALALVAGLALSAAAAPASAQSSWWGLNSGGVWDTATSNWFTNNTGPLTTFVPGNEAVFGGLLTSGRAVTVGAAGVTARGISFTGFGTSFYTVGSTGTITLDNGAGDAFIYVNPGVLGAATLSGAGGHTISGSPLSFTNNLVITNDGSFGLNNLTIASAINRASSGGSISVSGFGNTVISGAIGSNITGGITKTGVGTLVLSGANAFTGAINVNSGVLTTSSSNDNAFGAAANAINIANGATLRYGASQTIGASRVINLSGVSNLSLSSSTTLTSGAANQFAGAAGSTLAINVVGGTTGTLRLDHAQNYAGNVSVGAPALQASGHTFAQRIFSATNSTTLLLSGSGANNGSLSSAAGITVYNGAALTITQQTAASTDRLGTVPLTFVGGRFQYNTSANSGTAIAETLGTLQASGHNVISASAAAGPAAGTTLSFGALTRLDNATVQFRGSTTGASGQLGGPAGSANVRYQFSNLSDVGGTGLSRNVVPWASLSSLSSSDPTNLMTYDANGFRPLAASEIAAVTNLTQWNAAAGQNVNFQASLALTGDISVNSLFTSTGSNTFTGTGTITNTSGAYSNFNSTVFNGPSLANPSGAYFHLGFPVTVQGTSSLSGAGGVTVGALGATNNYQLRLTGTGANTFTGGLFINGNAGVTFRDNNHLGQDGSGNNAGAITLGGGQLIYNPATAATVSLSDGASNRAINVNSANGTIGTSVAGAILQIPGLISGSGQVQFGGGASSNSAGVVELTGGANTYAGGTVVSTGILRTSNANQLGSGAVILNGGTLQASGNLTFPAPFTVAATGSTLDTQANSITLANGLGGSGGNLGTSALTIGVTKQGSGALNITAASTFAGPLTVSAGSVNISGNGVIPALGATTVASGASLNIDDSAVQFINRVGPQTNLTLNAGTLSLTTNAAGSLITFGTLTTGSGASTINFNDSGIGSSILTFQGLTNGGTLSIVGSSNLGAPAGPGSRIFVNGLAAGVLNNVLFTGFGGTGGAVYDLTRGIRLLDPNIDFLNAIALQNAAPTSTPVNANFRVNPAVAASVPIFDGANTIASLRIAPGGLLFYTPGAITPAAGVNPGASTLTITNGFLQSEAGPGGTIAGLGSLTLSANAAALTIDTQGPLTINAALGGTGAINKTGNAGLTVNGPVTNASSLTASAGVTTLNGAVNLTSLATANAGTVLTVNGPAAAAAAKTVGAGTTLNLNVVTPAGATAVNGTLNSPNNPLSTAVLSGAATGAINMGPGQQLNVAGAVSSTYSGVLSSNANLNYNPTAVAALTMGGNNVAAGFTGDTIGNASARFGWTNAGGFGTGTVDASAQAASSTFSIPTFGFNFGANSNTTVANNLVISNAAVDVFAVALTSTGQTVRLTGQITGGVAGTRLVWEESGTAQNNVLILDNANNAFRGTVRPQFGTVAITSDGALGNAANGLDLNSNASAQQGSLRFDANNIALAATRAVNVSASGLATINTNGFDARIDGPLTGAGALQKAGAGSLSITSNTSTYTGNAQVDGGTLLVNGTLPGTAAGASLAVNAAATLGGSGLIGTDSTTTRNVTVNLGGTLSPGNSAGALGIFGNLTMNNGSTYLVELNGPDRGTGYDSVAYTGNLTLGVLSAGVSLNVSLNYLPAATLSDVYWIAIDDTDGAVTGTFAQNAAPLVEGAIVSLGSFNGVPYTAQISYTGDFDILNPTVLGLGTGNDVVLYNIVPAPGAAGLLGMVGLLAARRRRR